MTELMVLVERVVRPVRAGGHQKDQMREELLAHLTAIYAEERAALGDDALALSRAAARFGDPAQLTRELQATVSRLGRVDSAAEYWIAWRGGESALRYLTRVAGLMLLAGAMFVAGFAALGWLTSNVNSLSQLGLLAAFVVIGSACVVPLGWLYFRVRNAMWGGLGESRSATRAAGWAALAGLVTATAGFGITLSSGAGLDESLGLLPLWGPTGVGVSLFIALVAWHHGPREIRHTEWECLSIAE